VARLVQEQTRLCNRFIAEAQAILKKTDITPDERAHAARRMLQVKIGNPRNKQLLGLMETPEWRKLLDKTEVEYNSDFQKRELYALKEELFYSIDERQHQADLAENGRKFLRPENPEAFTLPDLATAFSDLERVSNLTPEQKEAQRAAMQENFSQVSEEIHAISQLLRAYSLYEKDVQYVVAEGKVMIVDENTGRVMPGRRWSDGLHQAVEAKERVTIERETRTYATVTIQNYFRMYEKLGGMTGTAETEATEFHDIYKLTVQVIPTNKPCIRIDKNDSIFKTRRDKYNAVVKEIEEANRRGQPVLVGTVSVEQSEVLSRMLKRSGIVHTVLNAKLHQQEAEIVARAGQRGAVTIATNMAGRGTDIKLGEGVRELGGLFVIGTERHQSRRVDRQLRGRCSRQGDPGTTKFFLSLEDELMRLFLQGNLASRLMEGSMKEGEELEHPWLNRSIESAQKKVEQQNFSARKRLLQYDDVLNQQREVIYGIRNAAIHAERSKDLIFEQVQEEVEFRLETAGYTAGPQAVTPAAAEAFVGWANTHFPIGLKIEEVTGKAYAALTELVVSKVREAYAVKESVEIPEALGSIERYVIINAIDHHWQEHLTEMESLRQAVGLRSYGQKDPLVEYKGEAYKYFEELMRNVRLQICTGLFRSASNVQVFENMLALLAKNVRAVGPAGAAPAITAPAADPKAPTPKVTAQVRTMITTSGKRDANKSGPQG
jgi:preprotein translocase subunit SecA